MKQERTENLNNIEIAIYALYSLGGWQKRIHTEDIALRCFELAPSKFSWVKHPQYPDLASAYLALGDAKKQRYGALVKGESERKKESHRIGGWILTPKGVEWIESNKERIEKSLGKHATIGDRLHSDRRLKELLGSIAYRRFLKDGSQAEISHAEFAESLVCTVNTRSEILNDRLDQLYSMAEKLKRDEVKRYVILCRKKFASILI